MKPTDVSGMLLLGMKEPLASRIRAKAAEAGEKPAEWAQAALLSALDDDRPPERPRRRPRPWRR